ncbi:MAG: hypothetical protein OTJ45_04540, partial [Alphaproteobacteria bacterium]|nr:hypothetical protein [Alphaproteobacteria bacterium]
TGNIDLAQGLRILHLFEELNKIGTTVVIATHDQSLITTFGRPEIRLSNGKLTLHKAPSVTLGKKNLNETGTSENGQRA